MPGRKLLPLLLLCLALPLQAQVYTWIDENGQKHFGNLPPTPEQKVNTVKIRPGYESDGEQPAVAGAAADDSEPTYDSITPETDDRSPREMCSAALRWTATDIPNLQEIAREKRREGKLTNEEHDRVADSLKSVEKVVTMQNCLTSEGKDRDRFECLSRGLGVMICSGALQEALRNM
jgi:hypothetical protein